MIQGQQLVLIFQIQATKPRKTKTPPPFLVAGFWKIDF